MTSSELEKIYARLRILEETVAQLTGKPSGTIMVWRGKGKIPVGWTVLNGKQTLIVKE